MSLPETQIRTFVFMHGPHHFKKIMLGSSFFHATKSNVCVSNLESLFYPPPTLIPSLSFSFFFRKNRSIPCLFVDVKYEARYLLEPHDTRPLNSDWKPKNNCQTVPLQKRGVASKMEKDALRT